MKKLKVLILVLPFLLCLACAHGGYVSSPPANPFIAQLNVLQSEKTKLNQEVAALKEKWETVEGDEADFVLSLTDEQLEAYDQLDQALRTNSHSVIKSALSTFAALSGEEHMAWLYDIWKGKHEVLSAAQRIDHQYKEIDRKIQMLASWGVQNYFHQQSLSAIQAQNQAAGFWNFYRLQEENRRHNELMRNLTNMQFMMMNR